MRFFPFFIFLCALFYVEVDVPMAKEISPVTRVKLKNGLTVILEPDSSAPVAAINVWVKVGSGCESRDERGLAHLHEHMLFKGTDTLGVGELAYRVESVGGNINAYTSFDQTVYFITSASRSLDTNIGLLADSVGNSVFAPAELKKEAEVVVEEIRRDKDSPASVTSRVLFASAYKGHPYGHSILGTEKSVRSFSRAKILNFYRKWYSPRNMVVVITGDFEPDRVLAKVKKTFGLFKPQPVPSCAAEGKSPARKSPAVSVLTKDVNEGYFALAFRIPGFGGEDIPALDVIDELMGGGESSRLFRVVKEEKGIVNSIYSYAYTPLKGGIFAVGGTLKPENAAVAHEEILRMFYGLAEGQIKPSEIEKAKLNIESENVRSKETMQGKAHALGFYETIAGDYGAEKTYMDKVRAVRVEDIRRVAAKYFIPSNLSAVALFPESLQAEGKRLKKTVSKTKPRIASKTGTYKTGVHRLKNGIRVIIKENNTVPLFAMRLLFSGGLRFEDRKANGISNFTANMLTRGTSTRSAAEIAEEMESLAGYIEGFSGKDSAGISMESLSSNFVPAMDIFSDVVLNPSFPDDEVQRAKREIFAEINRKKDRPASIAMDRFFTALFKDSPYSREVTGSVANVKRFSGKDASTFYKKLLNPENMVIVVAGDVEAEKVLSRIERDFSGLRKTGKFRASSAHSKSGDKPVLTSRKIEGKEQTHIVVGFLAPELTSTDYYPFQVLNAVLSGQGGRLFMKLRDEMSLAYTVSSFYGARVDSGYFGIYIGTAPQKEKSALDEIVAQLKSLLNDGVGKDEVERAQRKMVGNFEIGLQTNSAQASVMGFDELYGVGWDEHKEFADKVFAVTAGDVLRVVRKYIELDSRVVSVVRGTVN